MKPTQADKLAGRVWRCRCGGLNPLENSACHYCATDRPEVTPAQRIGAALIDAAHGRDVDMPRHAATPPAKPSKGKRGMSKTEQRYLFDRLMDKGARYEAITFKMASGHRYTPDFVTWDEWMGCPRMVVHEVKGSYRLGSYGRARLAFDQCKVEFPHIAFVWAEWNGKKWEVT